MVHACLCATFHAITSTSRYYLGLIERTFVSPILGRESDALTRASKSLESFIALTKFMYVLVYIWDSLYQRSLKLQDLPNTSDGTWAGIQFVKPMAAYDAVIGERQTPDSFVDLVELNRVGFVRVVLEESW